MTDAEIALQKEADASRLALEALKKEMNTGSTASVNDLQQQAQVVYQVSSQSLNVITSRSLKSAIKVSEKL